MDVAQPHTENLKHPVLASVLMGILRALDEDSTGKSSSSSSDDHATCRLHDRREPPCRRRRHWKSSKVEVEEHLLPSDEELLSPKQDFPIPDFIRSPTGSPKLHTILETEEEREEEGEKQEERLIVGRIEFLEKTEQTRERDAVKHLQTEEIIACSSTSSPLVTSDDSDVAAFLSKHEYATMFGSESGHADKILIPSRFVKDYRKTSPSVRIGENSSLKRGSDEELERAQIKKQKAYDTPMKSPQKNATRKLESLLGDAIQEFTHSIEESEIEKDTRTISGEGASSLGRETGEQVTGVHSYDTTETGSFMGSSVVDTPSLRKRLKTSEEESDFSSGETLSSDIMSDTVEESTASSVFDDRQVQKTGKRKKKLTKTVKSLRMDPPDDGMSDFSSDGQMGTLKPSMTGKMPGPKLGLGNYGWKSGAKKDVKNMLQKAVSTSQDDSSDLLSPDLQVSTPQSDSRGKTDASDTISSGSLRQVSGSDGTKVDNVSSITITDTSEILVEPSSKSSTITLSFDDMSEKTYIGETNDSKFTSSDLQSLSSSNSTENSGSVLTSSEKLGVDTARSSDLRGELLGSIFSSEMTSGTFEEDAMLPSTVTSVSSTSKVSTSSENEELSENIEMPSSDGPTFSSSLSTTSKSGTSSSKKSGIDPLDLPAVLRTGTQQPVINPLSDFYSSHVSSVSSNASSNASPDMRLSGNTGDTSSAQNTSQPSSDMYSTSITASSVESRTATTVETPTTPTESLEEHGEYGSKHSSKVESSYHSSYHTTESPYSSSLSKSITTGFPSRTGDEQSTTDLADDVPVHLSNINLTEALLRSDPSPTDFEDSDTLTSSSDEYITHGLMRDTLYIHDRTFTDSTSTAEDESMDVTPSEFPIEEESLEEPIEELSDAIINKIKIQEVSLREDVQSGYLPVLLEDENEESSDDIFTEDGIIQETSTVQQPISMTSSSESLASYDGKSSSDERADRLFMVDIDINEMVFEDILITNDTSVSSVECERLPMIVAEPPSLKSSEGIQIESVMETDEFTLSDFAHEIVAESPSLKSSEGMDIESVMETDEFTLADFAHDIAHFVTLNSVARAFTEILVNAAITRLTEEQDFSFQMEKALFPGIEEEDRDKPIHMHWISPPCYSHGKYAQSQSADGRRFGGNELQQSCKCTGRVEEGEEFVRCLERAFFPCLAGDDDDTNIGRPSSLPESGHHPLPEMSVKANVDKRDKKIQTCKLTELITAASRVSAIAVETISQMWSVMTSASWTAWTYIRETFDLSKVKRKDKSTQYDEDGTDMSQDEVMSEWVKRDEMSLHIHAARIVASAVTSAVTGKEYAVLPEQKSDEDYYLRLSASTVVEEVVANACLIHASVKEFPSATRTKLFTHSVSSERDSQLDEDAVSACSLSDIPLSSITFMRQQLTDMREIFQATVAGTKAEINSTPPVPPILPEDADFSSSLQIPGAFLWDSEDGIKAVSESASSPDEDQMREIAAACAGIIEDIQHCNVDNEKPLIQPKSEDSHTVSSSESYGYRNENVVKDSTPTIGLELRTVSNTDSYYNTSENVFKDLRLTSCKEEKSGEKSSGHEYRIVDLVPESRKDEIDIHDGTEKQNESDVLLPNLSQSKEQEEESVNPNDIQEGESSSTSSSALSLSDVPFSSLHYIREQLANVKTLAISIMDDFNSYAEERSVVAERSSRLTCSASMVSSRSSCDSARTIENNSSKNSSSLNLHEESKLNERKKSSSGKENVRLFGHTPELDHVLLIHQTDRREGVIVHQADGREDDILAEKSKVYSQVNRSLEWPNENSNAMTKKHTKNKDKFNQETGKVNEGSKKRGGSTDRSKTVQMTETHKSRQIATFSRNSPGRRHVISRKKGADNTHGSYSGESSCNTDDNSSMVSRPSSSFSDGSVSSGSRKVIVESESQGTGRTDVSCRISDRGIWVNTAFVNAVDEDQRSASILSDKGNAGENIVKNKIMINVKMSPRSQEKHSHRVRSRDRDAQLWLAQEDNQNALDDEALTKKHQDVRVNEMSMHVLEEVNHISETKSLKTEMKDSRTADTQVRNEVIVGKNGRRQVDKSSFQHEHYDGNKHQALQLLNRLTPTKKSSYESQGSEESEKTDEDRTWAADQKHTKRECLSDGTVSEHHQFLSRRQPSLKRKTRETKHQDSPCPICAEKSDPPGDLHAAPVISRSERTRTVLSMLDDVADNLSLDTSVHDDVSRAHTMGSFRKLFGSRKNKRRNRNKTSDQSPRVLSDSSVTESDGDSGSPDYSSDSLHTPRSNSSVSLLGYILRNLNSRRRKKKSKGSSSSTPMGRRAKKGSVSALDEMLFDLEDDYFIDDAFPNLVSVRDSSPSEDNTSLNEVLQDLIEEWSFEGLQEALDSYPQSIGDRFRGKLNLFMAEVRKGKRRAELLLRRATTL